MTAALLLLSLAQLLIGSVIQFDSARNGADLGYRWRERNQIAQGINPYDLSVAEAGRSRSASELGRLAKLNLQDVDPQVVSGYPPWGLAAALVLLLPGPLAFSQIWFLILSGVGLALVAGLGFAIGSRHSAPAGWLLAACTLALAANGTTLRLGQYGLILNGALVLAFLASQRNRPGLAGVALAFAAIKPSVTMLQFLVLLARGHRRALTIAGLVCLCASLLLTLMTRTGPIETLIQMLVQSPGVMRGSTSLSAVVRAVLGDASGLVLCALAALAATGWIAWRYRYESILVPVSAAAVLQRVATYHRQYDDVMLVFPMLALCAIALARPSRGRRAVAAAFLATLIVPLPHAAYTPGVIVLLSAVWLYGCRVICRDAAVLTSLLGGREAVEPQPRRLPALAWGLWQGRARNGRGAASA